MQSSRHLFATLALTALSATLAAASFVPRTAVPRTAEHRVPAPPRNTATKNIQSAAHQVLEASSLSDRFTREVWPILSSPRHNCSGCHNAQNPSNLKFSADPDENYNMLAEHGYLDAAGGSTLLARVTASTKDVRMPPAGFQPLSVAEITTLKEFAAAVQASRSGGDGPPYDERFPPDLLAPYRGKSPSTTPDNTFLTYYQLRGKIQSIFRDDWQRDGEDQFERYIDLFHGADFRARFNESSHPSTEFLAGVDLLSTDVASRSYLTGTGPFENWPSGMAAPTTATPSLQYRRQINELFNKILFRSPNPAELANSYRLLRSVYQHAPAIAQKGSALNFTVTATDRAGVSASRNFTLPVAGVHYGLAQEYIDETAPPGEGKVRLLANGAAAGKLAKNRKGSPLARTQMVAQTLSDSITLEPGDGEQSLRIDNSGTRGNVSVAGISLEGPLPDTTTQHIAVTDPTVQVEGGWELQGKGADTSFEDRGDNKGTSAITFPLAVATAGTYHVSLEWKEAPRELNAPAVLVEVTHHGPTRLAMSPVPAPPPPGEARFTIDETIDNIAFWKLGGWFKFAKPEDGIEITNQGTHRRVVADAIRLAPRHGYPLLLRGNTAEGRDVWKVFNVGEFKPYNTTGPVLYEDGNQDKGKLSLTYHPQSLPNGWSANEFYQVEVGVPGHVDNETAAPVIIHASESSPIIEVSHPARVREGAPVELDASGSYNLQRTPLEFTWQQTGGPRVRLVGDTHAAKIAFQVQPLGAQQAAWEALCAALVRSPDFLFTRPLSLASERNPKVRRRLQLLKIAQDLVARAPSPAEIRRLDQGASLASFVDSYLNTPEFRDFYFHRIRLYLESHGSVEDDEPVRLWCYAAFNNIPFQAILSADYTVNPAMERIPRPAYYGHTGLLLMKGFVRGKPGLPHFNYPAQVCEKFLGIVFQVPASIVSMRKGATASSMTNPKTSCYSCHKLLSPLAFQRSAWTDQGDYAPRDSSGALVDDTDHNLVHDYPYRGKGMESFGLAARNKEAFIRTMIQTHFNFYFGRAMRYDQDERSLYLRLWNETHRDHYSIRGLIRTLLTSPEYLNGPSAAPSPDTRVARLTF